jgi:hypothetical protein
MNRADDAWRCTLGVVKFVITFTDLSDMPIDII